MSGDIKIVRYKYDVGDLVKFKMYNGNIRTHETVMGVITKRSLLSHYWYEEAEKQVFQSGGNFLIYEIINETGLYSVKEKEVLDLVSSKHD